MKEGQDVLSTELPLQSLYLTFCQGEAKKALGVSQDRISPWKRLLQTQCEIDGLQYIWWRPLPLVRKCGYKAALAVIEYCSQRTAATCRDPGCQTISVLSSCPDNASSACLSPFQFLCTYHHLVLVQATEGPSYPTRMGTVFLSCGSYLN